MKKDKEIRQCGCYPQAPTPFKEENSDCCKVCGRKIRKLPIGKKLRFELSKGNSIATYLYQEGISHPVFFSASQHPDTISLAKRIVECVNAMEGIDDPEKFVKAHKAPIDMIKGEADDLVKLAQTIAKLRDDNRILLEALNEMKKLNLHIYEEGTIGSRCYVKMTAAIESVKGKKK